MALKIDYKDDGFAGNRKYRMITNADGTMSFEDVTPYDPVGDSFGALDINTTNKAINRLDHVTEVTLTATGWTGSAAPYTQTVAVSEATEDMEATVVSALADGVTEAAQKAYNKAFGIVTAGTAKLGMNAFREVLYGDSNLWEAGGYSSTDGSKISTPSNAIIRMKDLFPIVPSQKYKFIIEYLWDAVYQIRTYNSNRVFVRSIGNSVTSGTVISVTENEYYFGIAVEDTADNAGGSEGLLIFLDGSLEPSIGFPTGSATFNVYKKPVTDIKIGLKGV
ncbi:hypothetical protein AALB39_27650 [Lachnospiraceae bacterium 54-53]